MGLGDVSSEFELISTSHMKSSTRRANSRRCSEKMKTCLYSTGVTPQRASKRAAHNPLENHSDSPWPLRNTCSHLRPSITAHNSFVDHSQPTLQCLGVRLQGGDKCLLRMHPDGRFLSDAFGCLDHSLYHGFFENGIWLISHLQAYDDDPYKTSPW